jgi:alpha-amylase/alpha-mannosidase (GH57 family)
MDMALSQLKVFISHLATTMDVLDPSVTSNLFQGGLSRTKTMFWVDILQLTRTWVGEMAQRLRALTALPKVLSSNPSNHMVAYNHL